jgi:hypothetical protein
MAGGNTWSITIVAGEPYASFVPDVYSEEPVTALKAENGDLVSWNNQTDKEHQPWLTDSDYVQQGTSGITDVIPEWGSSTPFYVITQSAGTTVYYHCAIHPDEHGTIDVTA